MDAHPPCPDSALLAAFLDGSLADYERAAVVAHLVECQQCRAVALTVVEFHEVQALDELWQTGGMPTPPPPLAATGAQRWSRAKTRAPALAIAAVVVAATVALAIQISSLIPSWSAQRAMATLVDGHRPLEARLSGTHTYAPPPPSPDLPGAAPRRPSIQLISWATDVRTAFENDDAGLSRRAAGTAALLIGDLDDAIGTLEIAAAADPDDFDLNNDLAAAYYERSQRANRPDDLPAALSAVERVIAGHPSHLETLFNRGLIISALGLRAEAESAWQDYIARDPDSPWATEARRRMAALRTPVAGREWGTLLRALEATDSTSAADAAVRHQASATRQHIENILLERWLAAANANDRAGEDFILARIQVLGDSFVRLASDRLYADFVEAIREARVGDRPGRVVAAHEEYLAGLRLMAAQRFAEAAPVMKRAAGDLAAVGSPLSVRAQIELAATAYYDGRLAEASGALAAVKAVARERQHVILVTRAAWLEGMAAFRRNEFASARISYEEMLSSAAAAGDTDQWVMAKVLLANLHDLLGVGHRAWQHRVEASVRLDDVFSQFTGSALLLSASGDASAGGHHSAALFFQSLVLTRASELPPIAEVQLRSQRAGSLLRLDRTGEAQAEAARAREGLAAVANQSSRLFVEADVLTVEADMWRESDRASAVAAVNKLLALPVLQRDHLRRARAQLQLAEIVLADGDLDRAERAVGEGVAALEAFQSEPTAEFAIRASDAVWRLYGTAAQIALHRGDLARAFTYIERARIRTPQERRAWGRRIASLDDVQRSLTRDTALAVLTQFDGGLQIWVIRHNDVATHTLSISPVRASALVARHLQEMVRSDPMPLGSAELFDRMFRPVARLLDDATHLVIVADAPYDRIAFAGLWDRGRDRYVIEDRTVMLAPNATAFTMAAKPARWAAEPLVLRHAAIVSTTDRQPPGAQTVAESLVAVYGAHRMTRHDAGTATQLAVEVAQGDVVHVAARVVPNHEFPSLSHVQMADDPGHKYSGDVFARSLSDSTPSARLVALERGPGGGITARAEGAFGFARALLASGIPSVVSPVADIEPSSVERTWLDFHRHYATGTAAVESLRRAQLAALAASDRRPGPWATLTVLGSTQ